MCEQHKTGRVTIPTDVDVVPETLELLKRRGADAIRDCDGTDCPEALKGVDAKVYATYYTTREDNAWARANPDEVQPCCISTAFHTAAGEFRTTGLDAVAGSVGSGSPLRLISDIPGVRYTEGRFLPCFFPDTFHEGGDPVGEARENRITARRAILRKPIDRIGYGESVCREFRELYDHTGGAVWEDPAVSSAVKRFVWNGGGFIGVGEPSGHQYQGRYLQLAGVLGVEKETGFTLGYDKYNWTEHRSHFILADSGGDVDFGEGKKGVYALEGAEVLIQRDREVQLAVNAFGKGRGVYLSGLPYSFENCRLLHRAILWASHGEGELERWFSTNCRTEVHAYQESGRFCAVNNSYEAQKTTVFRGDGSSFPLELPPGGIFWGTI